MALSIFDDKENEPTITDLKMVLGETYPIWESIFEYLNLPCPDMQEEWNYSGKKYGWSSRIRCKNRVIIYRTPHDGYFTIGLVYGERAYRTAMSSELPDAVKAILSEAPKYGEGYGFRIDIHQPEDFAFIKRLIDIKTEN